jgi:hypothetical protein
VLGQHDVRLDRARGLSLLVGDLVQLGMSALAGCCRLMPTRWQFGGSPPTPCRARDQGTLVTGPAAAN